MKRTIGETKTNIVQGLINKLTDTEKGKLSDGYHTFNELYEHRQTLFVTYCNMVFALMKTLKTSTAGVWKSKLHHDGTMFDGMFIAGTGEKSGQYITYHLDMKYGEKLGVYNSARTAGICCNISKKSVEYKLLTGILGKSGEIFTHSPITNEKSVR